MSQHFHKTKKTITTIPTVPLGIVATVQNLKKEKKKKKKDKVAQQNGTVDIQCKNTGCIEQKHYTCICAFVYKKKEHKSMIKKKSTYWTNQKCCNLYTFI